MSSSGGAIVVNQARWKWQRRCGLAALAMMGLTVLGGPVAVAAAQGASTPPGKKLRVALSGFENNLTPFTITFASGRADELVNLVYDSLFWSQVSERPEPWLAQSATPSADRRTWTIVLRPNLKWQDGRPLTAADVKFTFDYFRKAPPGRWTHHVSDVPPYSGGKVIDARTVRLRFSDPAPTFKILPGADLPILPKHIWAKIDTPRKAAKMLPVGSGPFKVVKIVPDQLYVLKANRDYFKGRPLVDEIDMSIVPDPNSAFQALQAGQVDYVDRDVPPALVGRFKADDNINVARATDFRSVEMRFNTAKAPLSDARLRKAIGLAIDYKPLIDRVLLGAGKPGRDSWVHPLSPWALPRAGHEFDPERARQMLDAAGYRRKTGDLRAAPDGKPLEFKVLVSPFDVESLRGLQLAARQVEDNIGVRLKPQVLDPAAIRQATAPGPDGPSSYDAQMSGFSWHAHTDPDGLYFFFHSPGKKGIGASFTQWSNARFDQLVERATTMGAEPRKPVLYAAQRIMAKELPLLTLWYRDSVLAYRPAAYDRWIADKGHGIFTKRSFLASYARASARTPGEDTSGGGTSAIVWIVLAAIALGLIAGAGVLRRRRAGQEGDW
ncbi:MAG: ABC transporter substrate-binding protein [Solirubrobacteraceae bacterium]